MRENGYPDWPDPVRFEDGHWGFPDSAPNVQPPSACARLFIAGKNEQGPKPPTSAEYLAQARRWAGCMRAHGLPDWPDPDSEGYFDPPEHLRAKDNVEQHNATNACTSQEPPQGTFMKPNTHG
ncbi:hypothetical protein [Dactylosporangium sp. NPDC048998]|uniref:hypothetical protein n=1 Tax=Dactylosporangium sp. NPDC048998 TaxID=3363976 RepID=UPI003710C7F9